MATRSGTVRKTFRIAPQKLALAKQILGTRTDRETVEAALDLVGLRSEVFAGLDRMAGSNGIRDIYAEEDGG